MATELSAPGPGGKLDPFAVEVAISAPPLLAEFNRGGVISAADVHVATMLCRLAGVSDPELQLAAALAVRAPRTGHVFVDLLTVADTVEVDDTSTQEIAALPWPEPARWLQLVRDTRQLVGVVADGRRQDSSDGTVLPLRLHRSRLYLDRYWREEQALAQALLALDSSPVRATDLPALGEGLTRLLPGGDDELQRIAAACAVLRGLTVIAGGPGTGKTTTVAKALGLLYERAAEAGGPPPLVALCAPTGKAAVRLQEAVHEAAGTSGELLDVRASTIHRLLGWLPGGRFRHHALNRLPHDVVIVDETSMVALSLMVRLVEAVRPDAQLILVGDPDQLTAIEAGAVLRDIVGPAIGRPRFSRTMQAVLGAALGDVAAPEIADAPAGARFGDGVVVLSHGHRFGEGIGALADAIRLGDADAALAALQAPSAEVAWLEHEQATAGLRKPAVEVYGAVVASAREGDAATALTALSRFRLLCAHRHGPYGIAQWSALVERWLVEAIEGFEASQRAYPGCPLLITENDYELRLSNGDVGVIVAPRRGAGEPTAPSSFGSESLEATFERDGELVGFAPSRLGANERLYAMTIHKSQGSQFDTAAVILPEPDSRILTRELLYTAVTRARERLILVATEDSIRAAIGRPVARATGLRELLWEQ